MRISVLQPGARLHYCVPQIFARAGLLRRLYTDVHGDHSIFRIVEAIVPVHLCPKPIRRLFGRRLPEDLSRHLVKDYPVRTFLAVLAERIGLSRLKTLLSAERLILRGVQNAEIDGQDVIYTVLVNSDLAAVRALKAKGAKIVHECILPPDVGLWLLEERDLFPGIERSETKSEIIRGRSLDKEKYELADLIILASEFAKNAVVDLGCEEQKVVVVPYGLDLDAWLGTDEPDPIPGRVLFVGSVGLRKGSHYLAEAYRDLRGRGLDVEFCVVGPHDGHVKTHPCFEGPTYRGQVPRYEVKEEFRRADIFALPTLSESFGLVHLEALACGVPVITTPNCGSVVRDGVEGYIVPVRDARALADRIQKLVIDRELRRQMSLAARRRATEFSLKAYERRLISTIQHAFGQNGATTEKH